MGSSKYCSFLTVETVISCVQRSWTICGKSGPDTVCIKLTGTDQAAEMLLLPHCYALEYFPTLFFPLCFAGHSLSSMTLNTLGITQASPAPCAIPLDLSTLLEVGSSPWLPQHWYYCGRISSDNQPAGQDVLKRGTNREE